MKKYPIIYKDGRKSFIQVTEEETLESVMAELKKKNVNYICIADIKFKEKQEYVPVILYSKNRTFDTSISTEIKIEELKSRIMTIDRDIIQISFKNEKVFIKDLTEEKLKNLIEKIKC